MKRVLNVLVVEDDPAMRDVYQQLLSAEGHTVRVAIDGHDAVSALSDDIDLVVTDLNMPRMSGVEFIQILRGTSRYRALPILVITARPRSLPEALQGPSTTMIRKPFHLEHFVRFVESIANRALMN